MQNATLRDIKEQQNATYTHFNSYLIQNLLVTAVAALGGPNVRALVSRIKDKISEGYIFDEMRIQNE